MQQHARLTIPLLLLLQACSGGRDDTLKCGDAQKCGAVGDGDAAVQDEDAAVDEAPQSELDGALDDASVDAGSDAAATADAATVDASAISCQPESRRCVSDTRLAVCVASGDAFNELDCPTGCDESSGTAACKVADLGTGAGWSVVLFPLSNDSQGLLANYDISEGGTVATQTINGSPAIYLNDRVLQRVVISGRFSVQSSGDDDLIGFVFGYQDDAHFYLLDWKQADQPDACGTASAGVSLKVLSAPAKPTVCQDFWDSTGSENTSVLSPTSSNPNGWADPTSTGAVVYDFELRHAPGSIDVTVSTGGTLVASLHSDDATYTAGRFGFYNYSQADVRYEGFRFEPLP